MEAFQVIWILMLLICITLTQHTETNLAPKRLPPKGKRWQECSGRKKRQGNLIKMITPWLTASIHLIIVIRQEGRVWISRITAGWWWVSSKGEELPGRREQKCAIESVISRWWRTVLWANWRQELWSCLIQTMRWVKWERVCKKVLERKKRKDLMELRSHSWFSVPITKPHGICQSQGKTMLQKWSKN